jgi:hypothetical protein
MFFASIYKLLDHFFKYYFYLYGFLKILVANFHVRSTVRIRGRSSKLDSPYILFGLGGIALGLSRKIIYAEIMYSHGKIYLCSKNHEDVSFLAVCINKIRRGEIDC